MISTNQTRTTQTKKTGAILLVFFLFMFSQAFAGKISVTFRDTKSEIKSSELATNMLKIINGSEKTVRFYVNVSLPLGWTSLKSSGVLYTLNAGDSIFVPVKVAVN